MIDTIKEIVRQRVYQDDQPTADVDSEKFEDPERFEDLMYVVRVDTITDSYGNDLTGENTGVEFGVVYQYVQKRIVVIKFFDGDAGNPILKIPFKKSRLYDEVDRDSELIWKNDEVISRSEIVSNLI